MVVCGVVLVLTLGLPLMTAATKGWPLDTEDEGLRTSGAKILSMSLALRWIPPVRADKQLGGTDEIQI